VKEAAMPATAPGKGKPQFIQLINPETGAIFDYCGWWLRPGKATAIDVRKKLAEFVGQRVFLSLPPGVQIQLDSGKLQVYGQFQAREAIEEGQALEAMPRGNASHAQWAEFAVAQGMPRTEAEGLTRDQIRARFAESAYGAETAPEAAGDGKYEVLA
jgi:hypothetical protein